MSTPDTKSLDLVEHLRRQQAFSRKAFGPGRRVAALLDHLRKELAEIEADPASLEEWVDVAMIALDGAWRCGATVEEVAAQLARKQVINECRQWPDWREEPPDRAIEHVRESRPEFASYVAEWWDAVEWRERRVELIARSESEVRAWVDAQSPPPRSRPNGRGGGRESEDSLRITQHEAIVVPYAMREYE